MADTINSAPSPPSVPAPTFPHQDPEGGLFPPPPPDDDQYYTQRVLGAHIFLPILSLLFVVSRFYVRTRVMPAFGWDDVLLGLGYALATTCDVLICVQTKYGLGWPSIDVQPWQFVIFQKIMYCIPPIFLLSGMLVKASLIALFTRIAVERWSRYACWALQTANVVFWICFSCGALFGCTPIALYWDQAIYEQPGAKCIDLLQMFRLQGALNVVVDFLILCLPAAIVWRSKTIRKKNKLQLCGLFALGSLAWIASFLRIPSYSGQSVANLFKAVILTHRWCQLEVHITIIAACLPICRKILWPKPLIGPGSTNVTTTGETIGTVESRTDWRHNTIQLMDIDDKGSEVTVVNHDGTDFRVVEKVDRQGV